MKEEKVLDSLSKKEILVKATRDYLVELLNQENWCEANYYGEVLKKLVGIFPANYLAQQSAAQQQQYTGFGWNILGGLSK